MFFLFHHIETEYMFSYLVYSSSFYIHRINVLLPLFTASLLIRPIYSHAINNSDHQKYVKSIYYIYV